MKEMILTIQSRAGIRRMSLQKERLTVGQGEAADIQIDDAGLSYLHCGIYRQQDKVWVLDENSKTGSYVNGKPVPAIGAPLADGDEITIGDYTTIFVTIGRPQGTAKTSEAKTGVKSTATSKPALVKPPLPVLAALMVIVVALIAVAALGPQLFKRRGSAASERTKAVSEKNEAASSTPGTIEDRPAAGSEGNGNVKTPAANTTANASANTSANTSADTSADTANARIPADESKQPAGLSTERKLYLRMSEEEQNEFIYNQARNISRMMSNREYVFTDEVLPYIKKYVDGYARRVGNRSTAIWGEDLNSMFDRAQRVAPYIIREFNARGVPKVVGLYIPMIESEYRECLESPAGAKGLFQFMGATARGYGVDPADRCDVKKMAPAAAKYIRDRIAEFGSDSMSVALGIAGYNRSPDSVRRDLSDVLNSQNKERSFWTLIANSEKLDRFFQSENVKYVPKFFAAAIIGENPWAFGIQMNPLSTYTGSVETGAVSRQF